MTDMAKVQDALNELRKEGKRAEALQTAIDTVGRYLEAQPKLTNLEDKSVKTQKVLDQLKDQVKGAEQRLSVLNDEQRTLVKQTRAECKKVRDEAAEGMTRVTEKLDMAQKLGNERILEIDNEVGGKRKDLEAVRVELQNLQAKLAAA